MTLQEIKDKIRILSHLIFKSGNLSIGIDIDRAEFEPALFQTRLVICQTQHSFTYLSAASFVSSYFSAHFSVMIS